MPRDDDNWNRIIRIMAEQLGVSEEKMRQKLDSSGLKDLGADSLDVQELVLEFEEEFGDDL